jgi:hypothetical protein
MESELRSNQTSIRQSSYWQHYLRSLGWKTIQVWGICVYIRQIPYTNYSIIKIQEPEGKLPFEEIDEIAHHHRTLFTVIEPHASLANEDEFKDNNYIPCQFSLTPTATICVDLQRSPCELFARFTVNTRRDIRKAIKNRIRVQISKIDTDSLFKTASYMYSLIESTARLKRFVNLSFMEILNKMIALDDISWVLFAFTEACPDPISAIWVAHYQGIVYYLHAGSGRDGYRLCANHLLVFEAMKLSQKLGAHTFDFEGIHDWRFPRNNPSWKGFTYFKRRFNGQEILRPQPRIKFYSKACRWLYKSTSLLQ